MVLFLVLIKVGELVVLAALAILRRLAEKLVILIVEALVIIIAESF
jgi:hypothetical protein